LLEHLLPRKARSPVWLTPIFSRPDRAGVTLDRGQWTVQPTDPRIAAPAVYLADGRAFSWAETLLSMVQSESLGIIVGETTGGTNGNTNSFLVPGGYYLTFTGMKVLRPDGGRHHGVGITPGVRVSPTRDGLAAGRDQILERGLAELTRAM
jgi:C-terminal processing protease CtpA/Prc